MPTDLFYRLSYVKQQHIIDAIKAEITRVPYEEFSIYNVVHQCGISRGSFYQYFTSREDIYIYLLSDYNRLMIERFIQSLEEHDGDYFIALEEAFRFGVRMLCYKDSKIYRQHLFCNAEFYQRIWKDNDFSAEKHPILSQAFRLININKLNIQDEEELKTFITICMATVARECISLVLNNTYEEVACASFMKKLNLLKRIFQNQE